MAHFLKKTILISQMLKDQNFKDSSFSIGRSSR